MLRSARGKDEQTAQRWGMGGDICVLRTQYTPLWATPLLWEAMAQF